MAGGHQADSINPLDDELIIQPDGDGRFTTEISRRFNAPLFPQGGVAAALGAEAARLTLDRHDQRPRAVSATFAGLVPPGPVEIETEVIREGKAASQVRAHVRPVEGDPGGCFVVASFIADREPPARFQDVDAPDAPPPGECVDRWQQAIDADPSLGPRPPFFENLETRSVTGHLPWDPPWEPVDSEVVQWIRWNDGHTPETAGGAWSLLVLSDLLPPAVAERRGPGDPLIFPSVDLTTQIFDTHVGGDGWMLRRLRSRWAGDGIAQGEGEIFSEDGRLLAYSTQLMHLRVVELESFRSRIQENR